MRRTIRHLTVLAAVLVLVVTLLPREQAIGDDRDLLRTTEATPYVFFMVDSSASMNADVDGNPLPANGDDPESKLYMAKRAIYEVFLDASEFHYGFATYNQDDLRVGAKHFLYEPASTPPWFGTLPYPATTDAWVFGKAFPLSNGDPGTRCDAAIDIDTPAGREQANRMARGGVSFDQGQVMWLESGGTLYELTVGAPTSVPLATLLDDSIVVVLFPPPTAGATDMRVELSLRETSACNVTPTDVDSGWINFELGVDRVLERVVLDPDTGEEVIDPDTGEPVTTTETFVVSEFFYNEGDSGAVSSSGGLVTEERYSGYWPVQDATATVDCGSSSPFTGKGWEGNYDQEDYEDFQTGNPLTNAQINQLLANVDTVDDADEACLGAGANAECYNARWNPTVVRTDLTAGGTAARARNVDRGDLLPFDWDDRSHVSFLKRLNPKHNTGFAPDYGVASYFQSVPNGSQPILQLKNENERPIVAAGTGSPFAKSINDFRCWYSERRSGQCRNARFPLSWERVARETIGNQAGCVQPFLILVTDAENTCGGESPVADVAALNSQANVSTWVIAIAPEGSASGQINAIPQVGQGNLLYVQNQDELKRELQKIRGLIEEQARTFASAAVPTVQATVSDKIYVSNFTPVNDASVWPGTVLSFLKPLPLDAEQRPDVTADNFNWSAGTAILSQTSDTNNLVDIGNSPSQRRVYYAEAFEDTDDDSTLDAPVANGEWGTRRRFLQQDPDNTTTTGVERDLWLGLGLSGPDATQRAAAASILDRTYATKSTVVDGVGTIDYLLGDVFHSDPVIVGAPSNVRFFANDFHGYREFALRHENRRKTVLVGTNEGMLHAFDSGVAELLTDTNEVSFNDGLGRELWAFVPRQMLPELRERATTVAHDWGLDGSVRVADAFIDPVYSTDPVEDDREWRTVVVGGYRRGARGYYALDITTPDELKEIQVGAPLRDAVVPEAISNRSGDPNDPDDLSPPTFVPVADCLGTDAAGASDPLKCHDELPYPAPLWEFTDRIYDTALGAFVDLDEDGDDNVDLSNSWSVPNLGVLRVCDGGDCLPSTDPNNPDDLVDVFVAVFGGGLPASKAEWGRTGNWIYIVDVETGEAIYKRSVMGSLAAEPAAVDTNNDGYLDRIYFGTTGGLLYRIDLEEFEIDGSGNRTLRPFPNLEATDVRDANGTVHMDAVDRVPLVDDDGDPVWAPKIIFDTLAPKNASDTTPVRRPIFLRPSVLFVAELGKYALAFGTGDREDLWRPDFSEGRFYVFVDDSDVAGVTLPITESGLRQVGLLSANIDVTDPSVTERNFLLDRATPGTRGWYMVLDGQERLINDPFSLSGVSFFVTYSPRVLSEAGRCSREGDSRIFAVNTANANGLLRDVDKNRVRFIERKAFATAPFTEQAQTKNPDIDTEGTADDTSLGTHLEEIQEELKALFPDNCKFGNYRIDVKTVLSDTGLVFVAPIPVCIIDKNWKEFDF